MRYTANSQRKGVTHMARFDDRDDYTYNERRDNNWGWLPLLLLPLALLGAVFLWPRLTANKSNQTSYRTQQTAPNGTANRSVTVTPSTAAGTYNTTNSTSKNTTNGASNAPQTGIGGAPNSTTNSTNGAYSAPNRAPNTGHGAN